MRWARFTLLLLVLLAWPTAALATDPDETYYYGALRSNPGGWHILNDANHEPRGLTGVTCDPASGYLRVSHTPLVQAGVVIVTADETWSGKHHPGPSGGHITDVIIVRSGTDAIIRCDAASLASPSGNFWIYGRGRIA